MTLESQSSQGEFSLFPFLPAELRVEIWRQSCRSRVVEVRYSAEQDRCLTSTKPPVILQVCQESRHEGLRLYIQAFGTRTHPTGTIHFSPAMDILYIPRGASGSMDMGMDINMGMGYDDTARDFGQYVLDTVQHVQALAIDHVNPIIRRPWETYNKFCLMRTFPNLQEAFLILDSAGSNSNSRPCSPASQSTEDPADYGQIEFVDPRGNPREIMRLMERVVESFTHEVGQSQSPFDKVEEEWGEDDDNDEQPHHRHHHSVSVWEQPYLALVPKTKVRTGASPTRQRSSRSWSIQPAFVACV